MKESPECKEDDLNAKRSMNKLIRQEVKCVSWMQVRDIYIIFFSIIFFFDHLFFDHIFFALIHQQILGS